jgi:microcompartment protein CcmK/EutM
MALASLLHAQQSGEVKNVPSDFLQAKDFSRVVPQEKVYLHTDGNWYYPGDTIWYKAYVVRADDHRPTDMSRLLYVEFLNEQGYLVERQQLLLDSLGQASGQVATSDRLFPGFHEIRAYTKWMLNWGEQTLFSKVLPLYERLDDRSGLPSTEIPLKMTAGDYSIEYPLPRCNIRFYPEGGHMVYGLPARVAFELFNEETAPLQLSGVLLEDETPVQRIRSEHAGRGLFEFTPHQGHQYQVRFEWEGSVFTEEVKHIDEKGYTLRADIRENQLDIVVRNTLFGDMDEKTLRVFCRGAEEQAFPVPANTQETRCSVSIDSLRGGVNEVVLMDSKGGILLSRKVFIDKTEAYVSRCHISCEPSRLKPCGKVTLEIDWGAAFPNQSFSLAVTDKKRRMDSYQDGNIMTELLLQSDITGFVEHPAWYLQQTDAEKRKALDLLMMVQGWSRYAWDYQPSQRVFTYEIEKQPSISGRMYDLQSRIWRKAGEKKALFAYLYLKDDSVYDAVLKERTYQFRGSMYADSLGRFRIVYEPFRGEGILQLSGFYAKKLGRYRYDKQLHDPHIMIKLDDFFPKTARQYSWYEMNSPALTEGIDPKDESSIRLEEVVVKSKKRKKRMSLLRPTLSYDFNDFLNSYWDNAHYDDEYLFTNQNYSMGSILGYLEGQIVQRTFAGKIAHVGTMFDGHYVSPFPPDAQRYSDYWKKYSFMHRIDSVEIYTDLPRRPTCYDYVYPENLVYLNGTPSPMVTVGYINLKKYPQNGERFVEGRYINLMGCNKPATFYVPHYSGGLPPQQDFRRTLYWNPDIKTDANGKAKVEFFNNSTCQEMYISAEGITEDGKILVNE